MHLVPSMSATRNSPNASSDIQDHADHADRPSREEAEAAVRVLIRWAGDNPAREGLIDTPSRVIRSYVGFFAGYTRNPRDILARTFSEVQGYDEMIVLKDIRFESYCEHHMVPIIGRAHVAYLPRERAVGISKLALRKNLHPAQASCQPSLSHPFERPLFRATPQ